MSQFPKHGQVLAFKIPPPQKIVVKFLGWTSEAGKPETDASGLELWLVEWNGKETTASPYLFKECPWVDKEDHEDLRERLNKLERESRESRKIW